MYDFDWSSIVPSMPYLLAGLVITLKITVIAIVVGIVSLEFIDRDKR